MPEALDRCVMKVMGEGKDESSAFAICRATLGLKDDGSEDDKDFIRKRMTIAKPVGDTERFGLVDEKRLKRLVRKYREFPRQVPVFMLGDHVMDLDSRIPDGWVEDLEVTDEGELVAMVKLLGQAAHFVLDDRIRGASIGTVKGNNPDGSSQGEVLHHVLLTNQPFIKNLNIAAARIEGAETAVCMFTALDGVKQMDEKETKNSQDEKKKAAPGDKELVAKMKEQEERIIALKAESLRKTKENQELLEQIANLSKGDKHAALVENENLKHDMFLRDVRTVIEYGLNRGTLLASEVDGYAGDNPLDLQATERWLKASEFYDATMPDPEHSAFQVIKHLATKTKPRVNIGARFRSGKPAADDNTLTLSDDEKTSIREQGFDPERIAHMRDDTTYQEWSRLPKTAEK